MNTQRVDGSVALRVADAGLHGGRLPFGLQIVGPRGGDAMLLGVAAAIEAAFAGDAGLARPVPDIAALRAATPINRMEGFLGFG